jgi:hypothetical protein
MVMAEEFDGVAAKILDAVFIWFMRR